MATRIGTRLPLIIFPVSSTMQNSRSPGTPRSVSMTRRRSSIASALTGATWIQATRAFTPPLSVRARAGSPHSVHAHARVRHASRTPRSARARAADRVYVRGDAVVALPPPDALGPAHRPRMGRRAPSRAGEERAASAVGRSAHRRPRTGLRRWRATVGIDVKQKTLLATLPDLGEAPELRGITAWINSPPLTLAQLRGT